MSPSMQRRTPPMRGRDSDGSSYPHQYSILLFNLHAAAASGIEMIVIFPLTGLGEDERVLPALLNALFVIELRVDRMTGVWIGSGPEPVISFVFEGDLSANLNRDI